MEEIVSGTRMVAEGVKTARPLLDMAAGRGVEMPIVEQVVAVLEGSTTPAQATATLMRRSAKPEFGPLRRATKNPPAQGATPP